MYFVSAVTAQLAERWHDDLETAGSSPLCATIFLPTMYACWHTSLQVETDIKAILQVLIYKAFYDKSYLRSKTTMTSGEWTCLISFATAPLTCSER